MRTVTTLALALCAIPALADDFTHEDAVGLSERMEDREILLVTPGEGERTPLRYTPQWGRATDYTLAHAMSMTQSIPPMPAQTIRFPTTNYAFKTTVIDAPQGADFSLTTVLESLEVDADTDPTLAEAMRPTLEPMRGTVITETVTHLGSITASNTSLPDDAPAAVREQLEQMQSLINRLEFPEDPVAPGAVWRQKIEQNTGGFDVAMITTYTLNEINPDDQTITLDVAMQQVIPSQKLNAPNLPPNTDANITDAQGTGAGTMTVDLATAAVTHLEMAFDLTMDVSVAVAAGMVTETSQRVEMKMTIFPTPAAIEDRDKNAPATTKTKSDTPTVGRGRIVFINVITGEVDILPVAEVGVSVLKDDQGRRARFIAVNADDSINVGPTDDLFIKALDRITLERFIEEGTLAPASLIVDLETFRFDPERVEKWTPEVR